MKASKLWTLGLAVLISCGFLLWFAVSSYPQIKAIEERELYLDSLEWIVEPEEDLSFRSMYYDCKYLICNRYGRQADVSGVITPDGRTIIPCEYEHIEYFGGENFAAAKGDFWYVYDFKGREITKIQRETGHLHYAGGTWFIRYPDFEKMGFEIIDGISGQTEKVFDKYYNGIRLPDGTWYISKNPDVDAFDRQVESHDNWHQGYEYFQSEGQTKGFFLDEAFQELYGGQEYSLTLAGDGCYTADRITDGKAVERVLLDKHGEVTVIPRDSALYMRTEKAYNSGSCRYGLTFDGKERIGCTGDWDTEFYGYILYLHDLDGNEVSVEKSDTKGLIVNYNKEGLYQVVDGEKNVVLEPWFHYIDILHDREAAEVMVDGRSGIVSLKGGAGDVR